MKIIIEEYGLSVVYALSGMSFLGALFAFLMSI